MSSESATTQRSPRWSAPGEPITLWRGTLVIDGFAGRFEQTVALIGETPKRYRIQAITRTQLAGRRRWIDPGETALVPKSAIFAVWPVSP